jgi:tetratricopeptide (TPR) repeat protein
MDEPKFLKACHLRDSGELAEAYREFIDVAEGASDPLDKAGALLYACNALEMAGRIEEAISTLTEAQALMENCRHESGVKEKREGFELFLDYEAANLLWLRGKSLQAALDKFEAAIKKHHLGALVNKHNLTSKEAFTHSFYESIQIRRAFILADLGRWKEAMPILENIESPQEYKEGIAFYLGHCYLHAHDYNKAVNYLTQALKLGLPKSLEYRAYCESGMSFYRLGEYARAKMEFEKCARIGDAKYIKESQIWKWLEYACRALGLKSEAEEYARMQNPS